MLSVVHVEGHHAEYRYAGCYSAKIRYAEHRVILLSVIYAECHYAECSGHRFERIYLDTTSVGNFLETVGSNS